MTRSDPAHKAGGSSSTLLRWKRGDILGRLDRVSAERAFRLYQEHSTERIVWSGEGIEGAFARSTVTVHIPEPKKAQRLEAVCSECGAVEPPCYHAIAVLLRWLDVRATLVRLGPGSAWRAHSRHPFIAPARSAEDRVDLSHLTGPDLRSALELQLSLQKTGTASVRLSGQEVHIRITLPSGENRIVVFSATVLPSALPVLKAMGRMVLEGDLEKLELSEIRLHPVLAASWTEEGIRLEPGYRLGNRSVLAASELEGRIHGRWARVGRHLCRVLDPPTPLVPFHRKGGHTLSGREALRFLSLDHPQLRQHDWYLPRGALAEFLQPVVPRPTSLVVARNAKGTILLRPTFTVEGKPLEWSSALEIRKAGFTRIEGRLVHAPDLMIFEQAGFKVPRRGLDAGLQGDQLAYIRLVAETDIAVDSEDLELTNLAALLRGADTEDPGTPPGLKSTLRPYQRDGVKWLVQRHLAGVGVLLADDMGLGKTHQVMGLLCHVRKASPGASVLVVCPRGVLEHWCNLLETFAPDLGVHVFHGTDRHLPVESADNPIIVTTYDILVRSSAELAAHAWDIAIFDEAQRIKNPRTKAARSSRKLQARFKVALSGTPLENRLLELWSVVELVLPGYLGSERDFREIYRHPSQPQLALLRRRLGILTLRRLKEQVLSDLPDKVEDLRYCALTPEQREVYSTIHATAISEISELLDNSDKEIPYIHIFALMTRLKQVCDHSALGSEAPRLDAGSSAKLEILDEILNEALDSGQQIVIFSQYVKMLGLLSDHLDRQEIGHLTLVGATRDRGRVIRRFNSGQHERVLLASLLAGGVGIDLTGASVVIHYDRWWNPAKENQATDRVHRMGQKRFVQVFKLITRETIEERIDNLIRRKIELFEEVVAPTENIIRGIDRKELAQLLDLGQGKIR